MHTRIVSLTLAVLAITACDRTRDRNADAAEASESSVTVTPPAPRITTIELGKQSGGTTLRVSEPSSTFMARDTVYLSVVTANAAADSRLTARWTFQDGSVVDSSGQNIARDAGTTDAVTQFRLFNDKGWSVGTYTVDLWLNDMMVGTRQFTVQR
jgi:hypothetical protein